LSLAPSISASGNVVAFTSWASNLVADDTNGFTDVFARDVAAGTTERISVGSAGAQPNSNSWTRQTAFAVRALSADGRYVAFHSFASNLVSADTNGTAAADTFVRDRTTSTTVLASLSWEDAQGTFSSTIASISADGRFVSFESSSPLVADDTNGVRDVFVRDLRPNTPPTLSLPADTLAYLNQGLRVTGSFSDPDEGQTWSGTADWSDGAPTALEIAADKTFPLVHTFSALGTYTVRVTVTDSAGASATGTFVVTVATDPVKFVDERTGMWMTVQLDPAAPDHGHVVFTVPGTGAYELEAAADMRVTSATNVEIAYSGPAVFRAAGADPLAVSVDLRARLDPVHIGSSATLGDARGDRYHLVARPTR
ncbi:MAG TPA: PKD domain-containing protein, partial [Candidatus Limnocylindria bacterium]